MNEFEKFMGCREGYRSPAWFYPKTEAQRPGHWNPTELVKPESDLVKPVKPLFTGHRPGTEARPDRINVNQGQSSLVKPGQGKFFILTLNCE
jgi:hypothetical protein